METTETTLFLPITFKKNSREFNILDIEKVTEQLMKADVVYGVTALGEITVIKEREKKYSYTNRDTIFDFFTVEEMATHESEFVRSFVPLGIALRNNLFFRKENMNDKQVELAHWIEDAVAILSEDEEDNANDQQHRLRHLKTLRQYHDQHREWWSHSVSDEDLHNADRLKKQLDTAFTKTSKAHKRKL